MFNTSDLVLRNFKAEVVQELNERATAKAAKKRRAERSSKRQEGHEDVNMDQAFTLGLVDTCPRCGDSLEYFDTGKYLFCLRLSPLLILYLCYCHKGLY